MGRLVSLFLALIASASTLWFFIMTLRHEFPDTARNHDAIAAVLSGVLALLFWGLVLALSDKPGRNQPRDEWKRHGWGDGWE